MFTWNLRRLLLGCPVGLLTKKRHCLSAMSLLGCPGTPHKKRHCLSAMSLWVPGGTSHKKRHCLSAMSLLGARWDSNPRHSEPQSYSRTLGNPFVYAESQRFRFKICADFAPIFDNYCFNSLILSSNLPLSSLAKNSFVACSFSSIVSTLSICS